ncbi:MAG TPA: hypothetical protein VMY05_08680 [Acidobacteriota bacterium]|nr:hypothetical protein [Acidobacteriota bacterium]
MRKRVLVVETADATRGVAETVLRQNGFEVISVPTAEKASDVLQLSRPDLLIVGGDVLASDQRPFYEKVKANPKSASVPFLLLAPSDGTTPPFPEEYVIPQPFDPQQLLQKVNLVLSRGKPQKDESAANPPTEEPVDDAFLDAALGLDAIDVTDSEVMDKTAITGKLKQGRQPEKLVGYDHFVDEDTGLSDSSRIESVVVPEDATDIVNRPPEPKQAPAPSATGKLEIMQDQYGLTNPEALKPGKADSAGAAHDYDWFIKSMREDVEAHTGGPAAAKPTRQSPEDSEKLTITETSSLVDPTTAGPAKQADAAPEGKPLSGTVEKFIGEFKREMEALRSSELETAVAQEGAAPHREADAPITWEEKLEQLSVEDVSMFTRRFAAELAGKIAEKIAAKIDAKKLLQLIKSEIVSQSREKS